MKLSFSKEDEQFRAGVASWLAENLCGEFAEIRYRGGPGDDCGGQKDGCHADGQGGRFLHGDSV